MQNTIHRVHHVKITLLMLDVYECAFLVLRMFFFIVLQPQFSYISTDLCWVRLLWGRRSSLKGTGVIKGLKKLDVLFTRRSHFF